MKNVAGNHRRSAPRVQWACSRLEEIIHSPSKPFLPPMRTLCRDLEVSIITLSRALAILRRKGVVEYRQGTRVRICSRPDLSRPRTPLSARNLYDFLVARIHEGNFRVGSALPKTSYYALERGISRDSVRLAYSMLVKADLAHKKGRTWMVGPESAATKLTRFTFRPAILLYLPTVWTWQSMLHSGRYGDLCMTFESEATRRSTELLLSYRSSGDKRSYGFLACGREEITALIESVGERLRGVFCVQDYRGDQDVYDDLVWLSSLGKPVVWFDSYHDGADIAARSGVIRCHFDEEAAVREAVACLHRFGHTTAAFVSLYNSSWRDRRRALVKKICVELTPAITLRRPPSHDDHCDGHLQRLFGHSRQAARSTEKACTARRARLDTIKAVAAAYEHALRNSSGRAAMAAKNLCTALPMVHRWARGGESTEEEWLAGESSLGRETLKTYFLGAFMLEILADESVTALIAANLNESIRFLRWLALAGLRPPRDISIIAFDSYADIQPLPVTTIDFGGSDMGYRAFHRLLGDISLGIGRTGTIPGIPRLVERGSVGPPAGSR